MSLDQLSAELRGQIFEFLHPLDRLSIGATNRLNNFVSTHSSVHFVAEILCRTTGDVEKLLSSMKRWENIFPNANSSNVKVQIVGKEALDAFLRNLQSLEMLTVELASEKEVKLYINQPLRLAKKPQFAIFDSVKAAYYSRYVEPIGVLTSPNGKLCHKVGNRVFLYEEPGRGIIRWLEKYLESGVSELELEVDFLKPKLIEAINKYRPRLYMNEITNLSNLPLLKVKVHIRNWTVDSFESYSALKYLSGITTLVVRGNYDLSPFVESLDRSALIVTRNNSPSSLPYRQRMTVF